MGRKMNDDKKISPVEDMGTTLEKAKNLFGEIQEPKKRAFLICFVANAGQVGKASKDAEVDPSTPYNWRKNDPAFAEAYERAKVLAAEVLEQEAVRRAFEGVEEPTGWYQGKPGGHVRKYADTLLIFLLKGMMPEKYRERTDVNLKGAVANLNIAVLPDELLARIAAGENPSAVLASAGAEALAAMGAQLGRGKVPEGEDVEVDEVQNDMEE
jgi:hypothetical protein